MRYKALATDYDGTIAHDGLVDEPTLDALGRARRAGTRLIMVTGRELPDLQLVFPHFELFDRIVAENGAMLHNPATGALRMIAPPPPRMLLETLRRKGVPFSTGRSIVSTVEPYEQSVMALPSGITKASGLSCALEELDLQPEETIGVGDAENDHALLRMCGLGAAVANALPSLKEDADLVMNGARGAGVTELIDRLLRNELDTVMPVPDLHEPSPRPAKAGL